MVCSFSVRLKRVGDEGQAWRDTPELDLVEKVISGVWRNVIHAQCQAASGIGTGSTEFGSESLGNGL